jgi:hypothetical protein
VVFDELERENGLGRAHAMTPLSTLVGRRIRLHRQVGLSPDTLDTLECAVIRQSGGSTVRPSRRGDWPSSIADVLAQATSATQLDNWLMSPEDRMCLDQPLTATRIIARPMSVVVVTYFGKSRRTIG